MVFLQSAEIAPVLLKKFEICEGEHDDVSVSDDSVVMMQACDVKQFVLDIPMGYTELMRAVRIFRACVFNIQLPLIGHIPVPPMSSQSKRELSGNKKSSLDQPYLSLRLNRLIHLNVQQIFTWTGPWSSSAF